MMGVNNYNKASITCLYWVWRHENSLAIPQARTTGRPLTLVDTHVRGVSPTDPTGGSGITGVPTLPLNNE
nr:MAG TPA: hypothetical protein [Caudoviricetes sp.]